LKSKVRKFFIFVVISIIIFSIIPSVLAKSRKSYLIDFIYKCEIRSEGFRNGISEGEEISFEATAYALEILDFYGVKIRDITELREKFEELLENIIDEGKINLYDLYYILKSYTILDFPISNGTYNKIYYFLNGTEQISGGFSSSNTTSSPSLISTYYVINMYSMIGKNVSDITKHKNWILSCYNSDGGYGGNSSLSSTIINTYYAVLLFYELDSINDLVNINDTINYFKSFYINEEQDLNNFGGYLADSITDYTLLSSTYYCVKSISIIDDSELHKKDTMKWVLSHQNLQDGGFSDNTEGDDQKQSSIFTSYFAFKTLEIFDPQLSKLSNDIGMVEFNYWILFIIIGSIGLLLAAAVFFWRKRRI